MFTEIDSRLVKRQARWRQFRRAQHAAGQEKGWLTGWDMLKLLNGQRKLNLGSTYELIDTTDRARESEEENNKEGGPLLRKDKHPETKNNTRTQTRPWRVPGPSLTL